jgi:hypothetical protein
VHRRPYHPIWVPTVDLALLLGRPRLGLTFPAAQDGNGDYEYDIAADNVDAGNNDANGAGITFTAAGGQFGTP